MARLLISTVNFRTPELTIKCLRSVAGELDSLPNMQMIVVDNKSGDGSVETIGQAITENGWSGWAKVVDAGKNGGFAFGNNAAMRGPLATDNPPDFIWLLNPDAELKPGAGIALLDFFKQHPGAGLASSLSVDEQGEKQAMAFRRFSLLSEFVGTMKLGLLDRLFPNAIIAIPPQREPHQADWLSGSSLMIRREVFEDIGLMDEDYFLYFEETDFCLQAKRKNWELWFVPESQIVHLIGASTGLTHLDTRLPRRPRYWCDSRRRYFLKNFGGVYTLLADISHLTGFAFWRMRRFVQQKPDYDPPHYLRDFFMNSVFVRGVKLDG
jgi:GT2 family glycosyltransferase